MKPIALTGDIGKRFFQIAVHENHRDLLRCLWFKNLFSYEPTEIQAYRFTRLLFGASSSPFLLNATIRKHGQSDEKIDEEFARIFRNKFYVGDLNCGVNDVEECFDLYKKMKFGLGEASFVIRKWRTNDETLRKLIQECEGSDNTRYKTDETSESYEKILGVEWNEY